LRGKSVFSLQGQAKSQASEREAHHWGEMDRREEERKYPVQKTAEKKVVGGGGN